MPAQVLNRAMAFLMLALLAAAPSACTDDPGGDISVVVIGEELGLRDPARGELSAPQAVLLANVAQGLVRFDASGNIVSGLAERWNVSDDGLSYIFRIASAEWPNGRKISAHQVARILRRQLAARSKNPLSDTLGGIEEVVAMTDRVIEIRLAAPRPNLLALLAQPEFAILNDGLGTGPFIAAKNQEDAATLRLTRDIISADEEVTDREELLLSSASAEEAVRAFASNRAQLVLGGTFADLPFARAARVPDGSLRFDPASGLFGLVPTKADGPFADPEFRALLTQAIDRSALVAAFDVPGLAARATLLQPGLDGIPGPPQPAWFATPVADRRGDLLEQVQRRFGDSGRPPLRIFLGDGPGTDILLQRLSADWGTLGFTVERAETARSADLRLIDAVAPSSSAAWFLRGFRCGMMAVCEPEADKLLDAARGAIIPQQRYALLSQAAALMDDAQLFIPLTAPIRWSLVAPRIEGFAGNRYARHTLVGLEQRPGSGEF